MSYLKSAIKYFIFSMGVVFILGIFSQVFFESTWFTSSFSFLFARNNFHEVVPGKLYRSAALDKEDLEKSITQYGIKTVIDLRKGGDEEEEQGFSERKVTQSLGADYEWIPLIGSNTKQKESITKLVDLSTKVGGPVLIHCSSGTHRSGVAAAIWLMLTNLESPEQAANQLSTEYGYFHWERKLKSFFMGHDTIDNVIWHYLNQYKKTGVSFKDWVQEQGDEL